MPPCGSFLTPETQTPTQNKYTKQNTTQQTKECFRTPQMLPELFEKIHEPTVHCFAAVYIPDVGMDGKSLPTGQWYNFDATERQRGPGEECTFLHEEQGTGETRYQVGRSVGRSVGR